MVAGVSHLEGSTGKGISELSLGTAGSFLQGREAGFATLHFCKSLSCKNYFLFPAEFFVRAMSLAEGSIPQWPVSAAVLGAEQSFLCPTKAGGASLFSPQRPEGLFMSHSDSVVVALQLCWRLPWCHAVSQQGTQLWRFPSFSVIASSSSFSLRNNGLEHSLHIPNVTNAESTGFLVFSHIHFALWEVLDEELRCECTWAVCLQNWLQFSTAVLHRSPGSRRLPLCWELDKHSRKTIQYFWSVRVSTLRSAAGGWHAGKQGASSSQCYTPVVIFQSEGW